MLNIFLQLHSKFKISYIFFGMCIFIFFTVTLVNAQTISANPNEINQINNHQSLFTTDANNNIITTSKLESATQIPEALTLSPLRSAIFRARELLEAYLNEQRAKPGYKAPIVNSRNVGLKVKLAVWHEPSDTIELVTVVINNKSITPLSSTAYTISLKQNNGVNSVFEIVGDQSRKVLAVAHPIFTDIGTVRRPKYSLESKIYVPFASFLQTPEIITLGKQHLDIVLEKAYQELIKQNITSLAVPGKLITEVVEPSITKSIIAIEHVSAANLIGGNVDDYLARFYTILGVNTNDAYAYARSSASARGLVQFIPSTYKRLIKLRPELKLHSDFTHGMTDQVNAIKAQVALLDYNLTMLPTDIRAQYANDSKILGSYLAAMYNGGPARVRRAIERWEEDWAELGTKLIAQLQNSKREIETQIQITKKSLEYNNGLTSTEISNTKIELKNLKRQLADLKLEITNAPKYHLKKETANYVAKYLMVYDYLAPSLISFSGNQIYSGS